MKAFAYAMFYGIYGPVFGAAVLFLVVVPLTLGLGEQSVVSGYLRILLSTIVMSIWIVPFSLLLGVVPGIITGLAHWWMNTRTSMVRLPVVATAAIIAFVGGAACVLFAMCLGAAARDMLTTEMLQSFIAPGMAAGFGCALLVERRVRRAPPDISSP